ncbi:Uncharacterized protein JA1_001581 [Spathaspora sp. JA1]|nr:Uncharacterized protein JA1_001581 [Spathaspora sp. JA1]
MSTSNYSNEENIGTTVLDFSQFLASGCFEEEDHNNIHSTQEIFTPNVSPLNIPVGMGLITVGGTGYEENEHDQFSTTSTSTHIDLAHRSNSVTTTATSYNSPLSVTAGPSTTTIQYTHKPTRVCQSQPLKKTQPPVQPQSYKSYTQKVPSSNTLDPLLITFNEDDVSDLESDNLLDLLSQSNSPDDGGISIYVNENQELVMSFESDAETITRSPSPVESEGQPISQLPSSPLDYLHYPPSGPAAVSDHAHHHFSNLGTALASSSLNTPANVPGMPQVSAPASSHRSGIVSSNKISVQCQRPSSQPSCNYNMLLHNSDIAQVNSDSSDKINRLKENLNLLPAFEYQKTATPVSEFHIESNSAANKAIQSNSAANKAIESKSAADKSIASNGQIPSTRVNSAGDNITNEPSCQLPPSSPVALILPGNMTPTLASQFPQPLIKPKKLKTPKKPKTPKTPKRPKTPPSHKVTKFRRLRKPSEKSSLISSSNKYSCEYSLTFQFKERHAEFINIVQGFEESMPTAQQLGLDNYYKHVGFINDNYLDFEEQEKALADLRSEIYSIGPKILPLPFSSEFMNLSRTKFIPLAECKLNSKYQLPKGQKSNYTTCRKSDPHSPTEPDDAEFGSCRLKFETGTEVSDSISTMTKQKKIKRRPKNSRSMVNGESRNDRYYSRLNIYELSKILELDGFHISLTKEIEVKILELFGNYCDFKLGYQTWIRDTNRDKRYQLLDQLYSYSSVFYPEIDRFKLEVIIRRGSYSLMQTRLRRERRLQEHMNRIKCEPL